MVPCPSAMVVLLLATSVGRIAEGMVLIAAFSVGLASVLVTIGVLVVHARRFLERLTPRARYVRVLPLLSAVIVTAIGAFVTIQGFLGW